MHFLLYIIYIIYIEQGRFIFYARNIVLFLLLVCVSALSPPTGHADKLVKDDANISRFRERRWGE